MFNFSNSKGFDGSSNFGLKTEGTNAATPRSSDTVGGYGATYWAKTAELLRADVAGLVEEKDMARKIAIERKANDAGLRAVIHYLLAELRKTQPDHPLLDKKNRDKIFNEFHRQEMDKLLKMNNLQQVWDPLERPDEKQSP